MIKSIKMPTRWFAHNNEIINVLHYSRSVFTVQQCHNACVPASCIRIIYEYAMVFGLWVDIKANYITNQRKSLLYVLHMDERTVMTAMHNAFRFQAIRYECFTLFFFFLGFLVTLMQITVRHVDHPICAQIENIHNV